MTVNERLMVAGVLCDFDKAVADGDETRIREILESVYLTGSNADAIVRQVLKRP